MVDVHAEVIGSEVKRSWIKTAWAWRKMICLFFIGCGMIALGKDLLNNPSKTEQAVTAVAKSVAEIKGPDVQQIHQEVVEAAAAFRNGQETEIASWWRSMFRSEKKVRAMALQNTIATLEKEKSGESEEFITEITKVQKNYRIELDQLDLGRTAEAAVKIEVPKPAPAPATK